MGKSDKEKVEEIKIIASEIQKKLKKLNEAMLNLYPKFLNQGHAGIRYVGSVYPKATAKEMLDILDKIEELTKDIKAYGDELKM
jgi:methyl-accepting chemotaxis protein